MGVKELGLSNRTHSASLLIPLRLNIQAVTVVPTFAPMMTLIACFRVMSPELTKPTTMTVVADELCMIAVMPSPVKKPVIFVLVIFDSRLLSFPPALFSRACPITLMPNRNRQSPPTISRILNMSTRFSPLSSHRMDCIVSCTKIKCTGKESNALSAKNQIHVKSHITKKTVDRENQAKENRLRTYCFI